MGERTLDQPLTPDEYDDLVRSIGGRSALRRESIMRDLRAHDELLRRRLTDAEELKLAAWLVLRDRHLGGDSPGPWVKLSDALGDWMPAAARDRQPSEGD